MKTKFSLLSVVLCFAAASTAFSANPNANLFMGTWKLNEAKSNIENGTGRNKMVVYSAVGDHAKVVVDGVGPSGKASHNEWVGRFDGKYYRVTGDPTSDKRAYTLVNSSTMDFTVKHGSTVTVTGRIVVSANGKMRTVKTQRVDVNGKRFGSTAVYDKK